MGLVFVLAAHFQFCRLAGALCTAPSWQSSSTRRPMTMAVLVRQVLVLVLVHQGLVLVHQVVVWTPSHRSNLIANLTS